jgi:heat shock protein HslJ
MTSNTFYIKGSLAGVLLLLTLQVSALEQAATARYFNGPAVSNITESSVTVSLSQAVLSGIQNEEKPQIYFEYFETNQVCIMIYPTPEYCLPKKTKVGETSAALTNLKPNTSYTVMYKRGSTIRCITTPCPTNDFTSLGAEFVTKEKASDTLVPSITKNMGLGSRGSEVLALQNILAKKGYFTVTPTGYYGPLTFNAVKKLQKDHGVSSVGVVGPKTRELLARMSSVSHPDALTEKFEGKVTSFSTDCFADGECSITVDGKKVVTTIGWSQQTVGEVRGIPDFGSIEKNIGVKAKVYARKTSDGYTLYGNSDYFIEIMPVSSGKFPAGSAGIVDLSLLTGTTWIWDKINTQSGTVITPNKRGAFALTFGEGAKVSWTTDCNNFFGSYSLASDGIISFSALGSTRMYCAGSQESDFASLLQKVSSARIDNSSSLVLTTADGSVLYFVKK